MKKLFSFVAVLLCSAAMWAEEPVVVEWRTTATPTFAEKTYDGTVEAVVTNATFEISNKISGKQDVAVEVESAVFDSPKAGFGRTITITLKLTGSDAEYYTLGENNTLSSEANQTIYPKELVVDSSNVDIVIVRNEADFPLDPKAVVVTGAAIDEAEVIDGDVVTLVTTARFNDLIVGQKKTIYALYALEGADAANYKLDRKQDIFTNEGEIKPAIDIKPYDDGEYFHFDGEDAEFGLCPANKAAAVFSVGSGEVTHFSVRYSAELKALGFVDVTDEEVPAQNTIVLDVPGNTPCGQYGAEISLSYYVSEDMAFHSAWLPIHFAVRVDAADVVAVYNDVVGLKDLSGRYTAFQWYRDGSEIAGATGWYYEQESDLQGAYKVKVTTTEGKEYFSCERTFGSAKVSAPKKAINAKGDIIITLEDGTSYDTNGNIVK